MYFSSEIIYSPPQGLREKNMIIWRKHLEIELGFIYLSRNIKGFLQSQNIPPQPLSIDIEQIHSYFVSGVALHPDRGKI